MPCGRGLGNASVITLRSRLDIKVTRTNIREATMGSIGGYVFTTQIIGSGATCKIENNFWKFTILNPNMQI